jgi:hypothetical protein
MCPQKFQNILCGPAAGFLHFGTSSRDVLSWTNVALGVQCAPAFTGTFINIPDATSPYRNPITGTQQFFRLISN